MKQSKGKNTLYMEGRENDRDSDSELIDFRYEFGDKLEKFLDNKRQLFLYFFPQFLKYLKKESCAFC